MHDPHLKRTPIETLSAPAAIGPYSQAIKVGAWLFLSGQIPLDPSDGNFDASSDVQSQTRQVMKNLEAVLCAAGGSLASLVKTTIYVTDLGDFGTVNDVYGSFFEGHAPPARATVQVAALPKGAKVEIEGVAFVNE